MMMARGNSPVLVWEEAGRGERRAWRGSPNTIMHLLSLSGGRTLLGAFDPAWALLDARGQRVAGGGERLAEVADFRGRRSKPRPLYVSHDGALARFAFDPALTKWGAFSAGDLRWLAPDSPEAAAARPATLRHPRLRVENWLDRVDPTLNGRPLELKDYETCRSLAIAPAPSPEPGEAGGERFLLGTSWYVRCYSGDGAEIWKQPVPGETWAVNVSGDGRLAVAAFGDGSIRWYRMRDGEPLLALFPHYRRTAEIPNSKAQIPNKSQIPDPEIPKSRDWVLWAPDTGHFRCSPDGARLIGWQLNRGKEANPDFYSGEQLYGELDDRHGILQRVLKEARPAREIIADLVAKGEMERPRPLAEILHGVPEVTLAATGGDFPDLGTATHRTVDLVATARQTAPDVALNQIKFYVNGKRLPRDQVLRVRDGVGRMKFTVRLENGMNRFQAVAENKRGVTSYPATLRLRYDGAKATSDLWVLGVGVENYRNPDYGLVFCVDDVEKSAEALQKRGGSIFDEEHIVLVRDEDATRARIEAEFAKIARQAKPGGHFCLPLRRARGHERGGRVLPGALRRAAGDRSPRRARTGGEGHPAPPFGATHDCGAGPASGDGAGRLPLRQGGRRLWPRPGGGSGDRANRAPTPASPSWPAAALTK